MRLELELAARFVRRRSGALLRGTALAAFASVALATAALVFTLSLMAGYSRAIATALQRGNAHLVGFAAGPMDEDEGRALGATLAGLAGVRRASAVTYLAGLIDDPAEPSNPFPVVVKAVASPPAFTGLASWPDGAGLPAVVGEGLARTLRLHAGSRAALLVPPRPGSWVLPTLGLEVIGTFRLALYELDERWVVVPLDRLLAALPELGVSGVEVELDDPMAVEALREPLEAAAPRLVFTDWREMNRALFAALRWQTLSLFVVLSLVVAVASFQISSSLVVLAIDKRRAAGTLYALGAGPGRVRLVLLLAGTILGGAGVMAGLALGCTISWAMNATRAIRFPEGLARVYMVDHIRLAVEPLGLLAVAAVGLALVGLASLWPAWRTSRQDPIAALKAV